MQGKYDFGKIEMTKMELMKAKEEAGNYNIRLWTGDMASSPIFAFNQNHKDPVLREIFRDVRFRQAMSVAINRDEMNDLIMDGYAKSCQATVNENATFYDPAWGESYAQYDVALANKLLDEMGLDKKDAEGWRLRSDGKPVSFVIAENQKAHELVRDYWRAVGIKVEMNPLDRTLYWERGKTGDLDVGSAGLDNSIEFKVFQNVSKFWMECGDLAYAVDWVRWYTSKGAEGEEPPQAVKEYFVNWEKIQSASGAEYTELAKKIFDFYADELYIIGTVGYGPTPVFVSNKIQNVPEQVLFMDASNWWLMSRPDQWYLAE